MALMCFLMENFKDMSLISTFVPQFRIMWPSSCPLVRLLHWQLLCTSRDLERLDDSCIIQEQMIHKWRDHSVISICGLCNPFPDHEAYAKLVPRANIQKSLTAEFVPRAPRRLALLVSSCLYALVGLLTL